MGFSIFGPYDLRKTQKIFVFEQRKGSFDHPNCGSGGFNCCQVAVCFEIVAKDMDKWRINRIMTLANGRVAMAGFTNQSLKSSGYAKNITMFGLCNPHVLMGATW